MGGCKEVVFMPNYREELVDIAGRAIGGVSTAVGTKVFSKVMNESYAEGVMKI